MKPSLIRNDDPLQKAAALLGDTWMLHLLEVLLTRHEFRYGDILEDVPGICHGTLSSRLSLLVVSGVLEKIEANEEYPRGAYRVTAHGKSLSPIIRELREFGEGM